MKILDLTSLNALFTFFHTATEMRKTMDKPSKEKLCAHLERCLGASFQEMWEALGSGFYHHTGEGVALIFLLALSGLFGATNAAEIHQLLGLKSHPLYKKINTLTPKRWKALLQQLCYQAAIAQLEVLEQKSPTSVSRTCVGVVLNDTLIQELSAPLARLSTKATN